jgi:hypothetical protein
VVVTIRHKRKKLGSTVANEFRSDLMSAGIGAGDHAFLITISPPLSDEALRNAVVVASAPGGHRAELPILEEGRGDRHSLARAVPRPTAAKENIYRLEWDDYAANWRKYIAESRPDLAASKDAWPGDEWGEADSWRKIFKAMFADYGVASWQHCIEIGAGSGKYTEFVLRGSKADVIAFDVSEKFMEVLSDRMKQPINEGRLHTVLLLGEHSNEMFEEINRRGLVRKIDAMYSIDAMVHVDLQYLMAYLVTAALVLKRGGYLIL